MNAPDDYERPLDSDWIRGGLLQAAHELRAFMRTARQITFTPRKLGRDWAAGRAVVLNPLAFLATSVAAISVIMAIAVQVRPPVDASAHDGRQSLALLALNYLSPFAYYILFGTLMHASLWLFGARRPLRDSWAIVLFAGGGPAALVSLIADLTATLLGMTNVDVLALRAKMAVLGLFLTGYVVFVVLLSAALSGLHGGRARWYHLVAANLITFLISGYIMGLNPPGTYGIHPTWSVHYQGGHWTLHLGISASDG